MKNHGLSEKLVRATLDTLYINKIVEVWSVGKSKGKHANYFRLNYEKFKEYEQYSMDELKNPSLKIETVKGYNQKGYSPSYLKNDSQESTKDSPTVPQELPNVFPTIPQSTNNINNIEIIDNIENKEDIDNIRIEDNNINIEDCYLQKINELLEKGYNYREIFTELASTDWECYIYFKKRIKEEGLRSEYIKHLDLLNELKERYEPK